MTFAAPLFLLAVLAGAIPLLLHMINRQRAPVLPFSTLRFLRVSVQRTRRRKYLHDVLLLLLRIAALVLIAVGLAQPTLNRLGNLFGKSASSIVLILDNSASMATRDEGGTRWELAVRAAEQLLEQLADGDAIALLPTGGPARPDLERLYKNQEVVRQALDACRVSSEKADLVARLAQARQLLANDDAPNKEIYVVTDMQAISWSSLQDAAQTHSDSQPIVPVVVVDVHRPALPNVALQSLNVHTAGPVAGIPVVISVKLAGDTAVEQKRHLELLLDGKQAGISPTLSIPPGGTLEHVFRIVPEQPGIHRGEVRLMEDDASPTDNRLFFALALDPSISVAVVQPRTQEIVYLEDAYYLERALAPVVGGTWAIRVTKLTPDRLSAESLANYAVVYCVNLPVPDLAIAERLRDYARSGGHLFWVGGPNVDPVLYGAMDDSLQHELLPVRLAAVREISAEHPDGWHIGWLDARHPALAPLAEPASLHQSVLVTRHLVMGPTAGTDVRVLMRLDDGEPLLVERPVGSGTVLLLGCSAHVDWSNLPLRPIFLPFVARLTFQLAGTEAIQPLLVAGTPLAVSLTVGSKPTIEVIRPNGDQVRVEGVDTKDGTYRYTDTSETGIYEVQIADVARRQLRAFALNPDPAETEPAILEREKLATGFRPRQLVFAENASDLTSTIRTLREGESLAEPFLFVVLLSLVGEAYVANRRVDKRASVPELDAADPAKTPTVQPARRGLRTPAPRPA